MTYCVVIWGFVFLLFSTMLFSFTSLNVFIQDLFYDFATHQWLIDPKNIYIKGIFYRFPKILVLFVGISLIIIVLASFKFASLQKYRRGSLLIVLSLILVPGVVGLLKTVTNVYCPDELIRYDGTMPYVALFERYPIDFTQHKVGRCFPAAHSTIGFAFMSLFFVFHKNIYRWLGLLSSIAFGWIIGFYQIMRGAHFFYDTLSSMLIGWILIVLLNRFINRFVYPQMN